MVLGFEPQFVEPILDGTKIHTIREDKHNRWKPGMKIHFATGVRIKNYHQFKTAVCVSVQEIRINWRDIFIDGKSLNHIIPFIHVGYTKLLEGNSLKMYIPNEMISINEYRLATNDGFESIDDFRKWFNKDFTGKIIHWTDFKY